jgi:hypothetical protein
MTKITVKEVLLRYDVPLAVWAVDDKKSHYFGINYGDGEKAHLYYFARIKSETLRKLFEERIDARYVLTKQKLGKYHVAEFWGEVGDTTPTKSVDSIAEEILPDPGMFIPFSLSQHAARDVKRVNIDGRWGISDLRKFSDLVQDAYSFVYALSERGSRVTQNHIESLFVRYPWRGGFSSVNFFDNLYSIIPPEDRADIRTIAYASPGEITLKLDGSVADSIREFVYKIIDDDAQISKDYKDAYRWLQDNQLLSSSTQDKLLTSSEHLFLTEQLERLCVSFGLEDHKSKILAFSQSDPLAATKILLAYYRRLNALADYVATGKAQDLFSDVTI